MKTIIQTKALIKRKIKSLVERKEETNSYIIIQILNGQIEILQKLLKEIDK